MNLKKDTLVALVLNSISIFLAVQYINFPQQHTSQGSIQNNEMVNCTSPPIFDIGYKKDVGGVVIDGRNISFKGISWVESMTCTPGILDFTLTGQEAGAEQPELIILVNKEVAYTLKATNKPRKERLYIKKSGLIQIVYINDYYLSEARVALIKNIHIINECRELNPIALPPKTDNYWDSSTTFTTNSTLTFYPCDQGSLYFEAIGRKVDNVPPILKITQGGKVLDNLEVPEVKKLVKLKVGRGKIDITLINPYFKELEDRNVFVTDLVFYEK